MKVTGADVDRVARALGNAPSEAYTTPHVYPWAVQNFASRPFAARPRAASGGAIRLYVHVPFCNYRCTFCFFAVRVGSRRMEMERYAAAIARELEWVPPDVSISQLFVGGGTPTALPPDLLAMVLAAVFERRNASAEGLHTVEASPESIGEGHLSVLRDHGIRRVSMGIESLHDRVLKAVNRRNSPAETLEACRRVVDGGLLLNVDLIYGLPGQTETSFGRDLEAVAAAGIPSLSLYVLRLNEHAPVAKRIAPHERIDLPRLMRWRAFVVRAAKALGYEQTRCFTFERPRPGRPSPASPTNAQFGVGMSARSQLGDTVYRNHERMATYLERIERGLSPVETVFDLDVADRKTQFIAGSLGCGKPLRRAAYESAFGASIDADFPALLGRLGDAGLVEDDGSRLELTDVGKLVYDRVLLCFYPERTKRWLRERATPTSALSEDHPEKKDLRGLRAAQP